MVTKATFARSGGNNRASITGWGPLANGETGDAIGGDRLASAFGASVQVGGTFGAGGTVVIEGSNDGTNFVPLATVTTAGVQQIAVYTHYLRPRVSAGDGTTAATVTLFVKNYPST